MYSSSIAVYGDRLDSPMIIVHDELPIHEEDAYAKSKVQAEHYLKISNADTQLVIKVEQTQINMGWKFGTRKSKTTNKT